MLFVDNSKKPIYNSVKDLKADKSINEWFNLSIYDESTLSQLAQELENMLNKIPDSYFTLPPFDFKHFQSLYPQPSFNDIEDIEWFRRFFNSSKQLKKRYPLCLCVARRQVESFFNTNLTAIFTHTIFTFAAHNLIVIFNHFRDTLL